MAVKPDDRSRVNAPRAAVVRAVGSPSNDRSSGDTLPPTPLAALAAAGGADLLVLSADAQLIETVTRASREPLHVWTVAMWTELETALTVTRRAVVLVDAELLGSSARARIAALDAYSHKAVTLVAADRAAAQGLMGLISERKVHRLLIKPPALGITRLLIESAVGRCLRLEPTAAPPAPLATPRVRQIDAKGSTRRDAAVPVSVFAAAAAALLAGVAVIGGVSGWREPAGPAEPQRMSEAAADVASAGDEPATADEAAASPVVVAAAAVELHADSGATTVRAQNELAVNQRYAEAETALLAGDLAAAAAALADVRRADPASGRLAFLEAQLARAQLQAALPVAEDRPPIAANTELASLLTLARAAIERGELLTPRGAGARDYVERAERLAPEDPDVAGARAALSAALLAAAERALADADLTAAGALVRAAQRFGADTAELARLDSDLERLRVQRAERRHAELLALADKRLREGALLEPAGDNARHYLSTLEQEAPRYRGLGAAWATFESAVRRRVAAALEARDWVRAEQGVAALAEAPNGAAAAEALARQLRLAKLAEQYLAAAAPASELEIVERAVPIYPAEATRKGLEGWVDVEFVVDETGGTRDLAVLAAEPEGQFEEAALAALAKSRYRPFVHEGTVFARRVKLRMRFALE